MCDNMHAWFVRQNTHTHTQNIYTHIEKNLNKFLIRKMKKHWISNGFWCARSWRWDFFLFFVKRFIHQDIWRELSKTSMLVMKMCSIDRKVSTNFDRTLLHLNTQATRKKENRVVHLAYGTRYQSTTTFALHELRSKCKRLAFSHFNYDKIKRKEQKKLLLTSNFQFTQC